MHLYLLKNKTEWVNVVKKCNCKARFCPWLNGAAEQEQQQGSSSTPIFLAIFPQAHKDQWHWCCIQRLQTSFYATDGISTTICSSTIASRNCPSKHHNCINASSSKQSGYAAGAASQPACCRHMCTIGMHTTHTYTHIHTHTLMHLS